jgi:phosphosulfolactate synthase
MANLQVLKDLQNQLDTDSQRTQKPRRTGITMVLIFDAVNNGPQYIEPFQEIVDRIKLLDTLWHHDLALVEKAVAGYRDMNIDVAMGGTQFEVAKAQDKLQEYISVMRELGINEVEVENHASGATLEEMKDEVKMFKDKGFKVVGEVGKKWWWKDPTRVSRDFISVERTIEQASQLIEAGADYIYWEGLIIRNLIGTQLENLKGQKQLLEVAAAIDPEKLIFEVWDDRCQPCHPTIAWLVRQFGPNVNLANINPWSWDIKMVEWIRHGIVYEMDHPYMRWSQDRTVCKNWWRIESPDYDVDILRNYALKEQF